MSGRMQSLGPRKKGLLRLEYYSMQSLQNAYRHYKQPLTTTRVNNVEYLAAKENAAEAGNFQSYKFRDYPCFLWRKMCLPQEKPSVKMGKKKTHKPLSIDIRLIKTGK